MQDKGLNPQVTGRSGLYKVWPEKRNIYGNNNSNTNCGVKYLLEGYYAYFLVENDVTDKEFMRIEMPEFSLYKDFKYYSLYEFHPKK